MADGAPGLPRGLRVLCPDRYCALGVTELTVQDLTQAEVQAVLLDLDNTLVGWQRHDVPQEVREWLVSLKGAGIRLCLVSNTRFGRRLRTLAAELDLPYVRRAWKPRKQGFLRAMEDLGVEASRTIMVGDQMFTDVLGANRLGLYTVMVRPMARREFLGTRISRLFERALLAWFRRRGHLR